jgi:hypothetical protein
MAGKDQEVKLQEFIGLTAKTMLGFAVYLALDEILRSPQYGGAGP